MRTLAAGARALAPLAALAFVVAGGLKLNDPAVAVALFDSWGLGAWTVTAAGWVEVALGLMLFHRPTRNSGAVGLGAWMVLFGLLQLRAGQLAAAAASGVVLGVAVWVAAFTPRRAPGEPLLPAPLARVPPGRRAIGRLVEMLGLSFLVRWAIGGTLFWASLLVLAWEHRRRERTEWPEALLLYLLVLGLGTSGIWAFVGHTFLADTVSVSVGWEPSPFQQELAYYHLGVGIAGLACWWIRDRFWLAVGLIPSVFLYGAGIVHLRDYLANGNTSPANWGVTVVVGNVVLPTLLLVLLSRRRG